jgi:guanylate kinase
MHELPKSHYIKPLCIVGSKGSGKTTFYEMLTEHYGKNHWQYSVRSTTRPRDKGERDGVDFNFISEEEFKSELAKGNFLWHSMIKGDLYGTHIDEVKNAIKNNKVCVIELDINGANQVHATELECVFMFVAPPDKEEHRSRLLAKGHTDESVDHHMSLAEEEEKKARD